MKTVGKSFDHYSESLKPSDYFLKVYIGWGSDIEKCLVIYASEWIIQWATLSSFMKWLKDIFDNYSENLEKLKMQEQILWRSHI